MEAIVTTPEVRELNTDDVDLLLAVYSHAIAIPSVGAAHNKGASFYLFKWLVAQDIEVIKGNQKTRINDFEDLMCRTQPFSGNVFS